MGDNQGHIPYKFVSTSVLNFDLNNTNQEQDVGAHSHEHKRQNIRSNTVKIRFLASPC